MEATSSLVASLLLALISSVPAFAEASANYASPSEFIKSSCSVTSFPDQCLRSLSSYASVVQRSPLRLTQAALAVSLTRSRSAAGFITKLASQPATPDARLSLREKGAIKDCITTLTDSAYRLGQSIDEAKNLGRTQFRWHISNVQTWVSGALTNQYTCLNGFGGMGMRSSKVRALVRREIVGVTQVTSNALALVNKLAGQNI